MVDYVYLFRGLLYCYPPGVQQQKLTETVRISSNARRVARRQQLFSLRGDALLGCGRGCVPSSEHDTLRVYDGYTIGISMESTPSMNKHDTFDVTHPEWIDDHPQKYGTLHLLSQNGNIFPTLQRGEREHEDSPAD